MELIPTPEARPTKQERLLQLAERRHQVAVGAAALDALFLYGTGDVSDMEIEAAFPDTGLSQRASQMRGRIIDAYKKTQQYAIEEDAELREYVKNFGDNSSFSETIFEFRTGRKPRGEVDFYRKGSVFMMYCADPIDYAAACEGKDDIEESLSGGTYHDSMKLEILGSNSETMHIQVALVSHDSSIGEPSVFEAHELQHHINHELLEEFRNARTVPKNMKKALEKSSQIGEEALAIETVKLHEFYKFTGIQDEVLAFIKDGHTDLRSELRADSELYRYIFFNDFIGDFSEEALTHIADIADVMDEIAAGPADAVLYDYETRALLVYQLIDLPLQKFASWLKILNEMYISKLRVLDQYMDSTLSSADTHSDDIQAAKKEYASIFWDSRRAILLSQSEEEIASIVEELEVAYNQYKQELQLQLQLQRMRLAA